VHPTQVVQQPIAELAHLVGLTRHRRPLLLHLKADLLGHLPCLLQHPLRLAGDLRPQLLGLLLGLLNDRLGPAPAILDQLLGRAAGLLQQRGGLPTDLLEGRRPLPQADDLALELGPCPFASGVLVDRLLQACGELGEVGVDLLAVVATPHHLKGWRSLVVGPSSLRVRLVRAHGTPSIHDAHNPSLAPRQQDRISSTYSANRRTQSTARRQVRQLPADSQESSPIMIARLAWDLSGNKIGCCHYPLCSSDAIRAAFFGCSVLHLGR
jgi:hypothetical protein